ncbi:MAG TPA: TauD/TfdA family dioxygenase [Solirubrobacteraceae bacterium]|nr:TauD/TfdA family dioxygenase [Solirubrobacteraceae bacterium]
MSNSSHAGDYEHIEVRRIGGNIGAEVGAVVADGELADGVVRELRRALLRHRVIFLTGQNIESDTQLRFAKLLGTPTKPHPTVTGDGRAVLPIDSEQGKANSWHTDVTFVDRIPAISVLRAVTLPPYGGTTVWANTVRAYETLPMPLKVLAERLRAVHSNRYDYAGHRGEERIGGVDVKEQAYRQEFEQLEYIAEHPVIRVHPETGEPAFVLGHFVRGLVGLHEPDSRALFDAFQRHITRLENTVRWTWAPGDIAIWDNRSTQHYAVADYDEHPRMMHRITLAGDIPVGLDGIPSAAIKGDASTYSEVAAPPRAEQLASF